MERNWLAIHGSRIHEKTSVVCAVSITVSGEYKLEQVERGILLLLLFAHFVSLYPLPDRVSIGIHLLYAVAVEELNYLFSVALRRFLSNNLECNSRTG